LLWSRCRCCSSHSFVACGVALKNFFQLKIIQFQLFSCFWTRVDAPHERGDSCICFYSYNVKTWIDLGPSLTPWSPPRRRGPIANALRYGSPLSRGRHKLGPTTFDPPWIPGPRTQRASRNDKIHRQPHPPKIHAALPDIRYCNATLMCYSLRHDVFSDLRIFPADAAIAARL
jgi:hypothetical protein